jgi:hypothetical protein
LEQYHAYTIAKNSEDIGYQDVVDRLKRKPIEREAADPAKNAKRRA